ncbi:MAG TPA: outer membrane beta-barrel protein [Chryseolinea sp.]
MYQFCTFFFCVCLATTAAAQSSPGIPNHKIISKYELTAGIGSLKSDTYYPVNENKIGYSFGGGVSHVFSKTFELKVRALYELKGSKTKFGSAYSRDNQTTEVTSVISTNLHYVTASLMPTFHLLKNKRLLIGAGGFYSVMTSISIYEDRTDNNTGVTTSFNHTTGNTSHLTSQRDFGVSAYSGYVIPLSQKKDLTFMLHYNKSLTDFDDGFNSWQRSNVILLSATLGLYR